MWEFSHVTQLSVVLTMFCTWISVWFSSCLFFLLSLKFHAGLFRKEHHFIATLNDVRAVWGLWIKSRDWAQNKCLLPAMERKKNNKACVCVSIYFSSSCHFLQWKFSESIFMFFLLEYCLHSRSKSSSDAIPAVSDGRKGEFLVLERLWHSEPPASRGCSSLPSTSGASLLERQRGFQRATRHQVTSRKIFLLWNHPWNSKKSTPQQPAPSWAWWRCVCEAGREGKTKYWTSSRDKLDLFKLEAPIHTARCTAENDTVRKWKLIPAIYIWSFSSWKGVSIE